MPERRWIRRSGVGEDGVKVRVWAHTLALEPACQLRNQDVATSCHGALPDSTIARLSLCICKSSPELLVVEVVEGVRSDVLFLLLYVFRFPFSGVTWTGEPACI
jgi:hypothetical protein